MKSGVSGPSGCRWSGCCSLSSSASCSESTGPSAYATQEHSSACQHSFRMNCCKLCLRCLNRECPALQSTSNVQLWRFFLFLGCLPLIYVASNYILLAAVWFFESQFFTTTNVLYFVIALKVLRCMPARISWMLGTCF